MEIMNDIHGQTDFGIAAMPRCQSNMRIGGETDAEMERDSTKDLVDAKPVAHDSSSSALLLGVGSSIIVCPKYSAEGGTPRQDK
jgi:UDP-N-acetylenolpyruvoylglucosamine reductase